MGPADLFLSPDLTEAQARAYLQSLGFRDATLVDECLQRIADDLVVREALGRLAPDLITALLETPDPDTAASNVAHYLSARSGRAMLLDYLRDDPRALHVLTYVMGASPPLSEILIRTPEYFHWLVSQVERSAPDREDHEEELVSAFAAVDDPVEGMQMLRRWKRREMLRIGTRDLLRHETVQTVATQLFDVAAVAIDFALAIVMQQRLEASGRQKPPGAVAVIGLGDLGSGEMSYDSEVDLLCVFDPTGEDARAAGEFFTLVGRDLVAAVQADTREGAMYRVRAARPALTRPLDDYERRAAGFESGAVRLAFTRARPVAGDALLGARFMTAVEGSIYGGAANGVDAEDVRQDLRGLDIETTTQVLQLAHGGRHTTLRRSGTLGVLAVLSRTGLIAQDICRELDHAYVFLRAARHRRELGLADDQETQLNASRERARAICAGLLEQEFGRSGG